MCRQVCYSSAKCGLLHLIYFVMGCTASLIFQFWIPCFSVSEALHSLLGLFLTEGIPYKTNWVYYMYNDI